MPMDSIVGVHRREEAGGHETRRPRITVLGTGYLGTAHAACLAELGFEVLGVDVYPAKIDALTRGELPFYEPGLQPLLRAGLASGRLSFTTSYAHAAAFGDVHFVCVGTPQRDGTYAADLSQLNGCIAALAPLLNRPCLVAGKSTVPVGTAQILAGRLARLSPAGDASSSPGTPNSCGRGTPSDTLRPDRIVAGVTSARAEAMLREIYAGPVTAGTPFLVTDLPTAELVKVAANAFLATKISFINAMAEVCEAPAPTSCNCPRRSASTRGSAARRCGPGSASAAAACPRTSARSWPAPRNSGSTRPCRSCAKWTRSTCAAAPGWSTSPANWPAAR